MSILQSNISPLTEKADIPSHQNKILELLTEVYGDAAPSILENLNRSAQKYPQAQNGNDNHRWLDQRDAMLISYGDSLQQEGEAPLQTLQQFLHTHVGEALNAVHLLPFYPYSSDDGFSVIDYRAVNERVGTWDHVTELADQYLLMFDAVINHISAESEWFQGFKNGDPQYTDYFTVAAPTKDYSAVTRPRTTPLLTPVETKDGLKHVWCTFSADQVDLNYANPDVFVAIADLLLFYISQGARYLRLDAIGFLWKIDGTTCIHLPQTHKLIQALRLFIEAYDARVLLITETNVPHKDNISYFGDGTNEAHLVYQFPLPPLVFHSFHTQDVTALAQWAQSLEPRSERTTFFNFLASHDGIGVRPVEGILTKDQVGSLVEKVHGNGGRVSYKTNPDGSESPYELNINYYDALRCEGEPEDHSIAKFLAAQSILLSLSGLPGIYIHSLLGSVNDLAGVARTGRNRSINREVLSLPALEEELADSTSRRAKVFSQFKHLLTVRQQCSAFAPNVAQTVRQEGVSVLCIERHCPTQPLTAYINVGETPATVTVPAGLHQDQISGQSCTPGETLTLAPFQACWLTA